MKLPDYTTTPLVIFSPAIQMRCPCSEQARSMLAVTGQHTEEQYPP